MTKYARIREHIVQDLFDTPDGFTIAQCFPPDLAALYVPVPPTLNVIHGWHYDSGVFTQPDVMGPKPTVVTFNNLIGRLTQEERVALATTAQSNPQILIWMTMGAAANQVNLLSPDTSAGMGVLQQAGILTSQRVSEVLTP